jgi:hypothetical protein
MKSLLAAIVGIGVAMAVLTGASGSGSPEWGFMLLKCFPYALFAVISTLLLAARMTSAYLGLVLAGLGLIGLDVAVYVSVFYFPASSTDAIALFTTPFVQAFGVLPLMFPVAAIARWVRRIVRSS